MVAAKNCLRHGKHGCVFGSKMLENVEKCWKMLENVENISPFKLMLQILKLYHCTFRMSRRVEKNSPICSQGEITFDVSVSEQIALTRCLFMCRHRYDIYIGSMNWIRGTKQNTFQTARIARSTGVLLKIFGQFSKTESSHELKSIFSNVKCIKRTSGIQRYFATVIATVTEG